MVKEGKMPIENVQTDTTMRRTLRFSGIKFNFEGQPVEVKGELPYHKLMENIEPNWELVHEVASELGSWVDEEFSGASDSAKGDLPSLQPSAMTDHAVCAYYGVFKLVADENSPKFKKVMTACARFCLISWVWDDIMERTKGSNLTLMAEKQRKFTEIVTNAFRNVGLMKNVSKHRFKMEYRRTKFGKEYPQYRVHAYLLVFFNRYMVEEHECDQTQIQKIFFKWMDTMSTNPAWKSNLPIGSDLQPRFYTSGVYPALCFGAMLAKIKRDQNEVENDVHVHRLELLCNELTIFVNDLFSLEREYLEEDPNNLVLASCSEGMQFEAALQKFLEERKNLFTEFDNLYQHIKTTYQHHSQKNLLEYADAVWNHCAGIWPGHVHMSRYSNFDISIV